MNCNESCNIFSDTNPGFRPFGFDDDAYDAATGNLSTITAPSGEALAFTYDGSLVTSETMTGPVSGSVGLTYDNDFRVTSQTINGANAAGYSYDADGLLTGAGVLSITRDAGNGLLTSTALSNITTALTYNTFGEVTDYSATDGANGLFSTTYTRDKLGRITGLTETIGGVTDTYAYTYDTGGRLTDVTKNGASVGAYTYDQNGNRLTYTGQRGTFSGTYDAQDRLTSYGAATYTYTDNGELLTKTDNVGTTTYTYDVLGNLTSVTLPAGTVIDYVTDGRNRRVGKKVNGTLIQGFIYGDQLNPVAELDGAGNIVARFVYGTRANVPDYMVKGGTTYRIISDHLGSPRLVVDATTGVIVQRMDYDEFGNVLSDTNPGFQPFGFAGGIYDQDTGLVRFGARDYDPDTGRWTAKDPILFAGGDTNLYGYTLGDPVNFVDPLGQARGDWWDPRTYISISFSEGLFGQGKTFSNGHEQETLTFFDLFGASFDINIGILPNERELVSEIGFGLGDHLGIGYFFGRPNKAGGFDVGGIVIHIGVGLGTPIYVSGTFPEGVTCPTTN